MEGRKEKKIGRHFILFGETEIEIYTFHTRWHGVEYYRSRECDETNIFEMKRESELIMAEEEWNCNFLKTEEREKHPLSDEAL